MKNFDTDSNRLPSYMQSKHYLPQDVILLSTMSDNAAQIRVNVAAREFTNHMAMSHFINENLLFIASRISYSLLYATNHRSNIVKVFIQLERHLTQN